MKIFRDFFKQVKQQIEFLFEIHNNLEPSAELLLLQADCNPDMPTAKLIDKAVETKFKLAEAYPFGVDYLIALNSNFILEAVQKYPDLVRWLKCYIHF